MQDSFLNIYPKLTQVQADHNLNLTGLWLAHGDEPLLQQWLVDAMRRSWHLQNLAIKRIELVSAKTWLEVLTELNSLSLFDDATAVIITGNHKPDKDVQQQLETFAIEANAGNNQNCVLWLTAKVDKRAQSSKWFAPFAKFGQVIDCNLYNENQRQQLLSLHAQRFGLALQPEAWQFLMVQTEHHLLSAYQALWRLSYLFAPQIAELNAQSENTEQPTASFSIDVEALQAALVSDAQYSVFDLSDAMLAGNATQVVKIIEQLRATEEPTPLVLWAISKDMRLILQLLDGQDPQSIGIWSSKQSLYQSACRRQTPQSVADWADILYQCDKSVKGVNRQPAWELILQAALRVTGVKLFA
ncbi:DNA polymerase III subunit delta [Psychrobacter sp. FDAARGOS_221]|uniref:DNA polymerase III subunit delta n=1 Tax=Psychrobacter sp. FDAARGOS_221 TaxID=1975705 RepID=UPI000BB57E3A|nr:DNA polymerase III subunit delta [Psychrobacter sp. FDAARGOS_221]PNK61327.1 DNA polymerase III subunit delta [Psychrobacter sp. FDAARGOS_221]